MGAVDGGSVVVVVVGFSGVGVVVVIDSIVGAGGVWVGSPSSVSIVMGLVDCGE